MNKLIKVRVTRRGTSGQESEKPQLGNVKDELFLISFIILCAGLIYTDAYYQRFGFKYNFLNLSTMHIIYKGITMVIKSPFMLIPYVLVIALVLFETYAIGKQMKIFLVMRTPIIYFFLVANLLIIYPTARYAGSSQALSDMFEETSSLPKLRRLQARSIELKSPEDRYLLFLVDSDFVTIFAPLRKDETNAFPIIKRISKNEVSILETRP